MSEQIDGEPLDPASRLRSEHTALDERFRRLAARFERDDWSALTSAFGDFADDLRAHLAFEEHDLFPAFAEHAPELVAKLGGQHDELRQRLDELAANITRRHVDRAHLDRLGDELRLHAALEVAHVYPWLEAGGATPPRILH